MSILNSVTSFDLFSDLAIGITKLSGADNKSYLQGQLTCDVEHLTPRTSLLGAQCDAKGKMMAVLRLLQHNDDVLALQDIDNVMSHLPSLKKYAVFAKVDIVDASNEFHCTGLAGNDAVSWLQQFIEQPLANDEDTTNSPFGLISFFPQAVNGVVRALIISRPEQATALHQALSDTTATIADHALWFVQDILSGTPKVCHDSQGQFVPQMLNLQMVEGISFKKGCYIGQETVARMHFRGLNKRAMYILSASSHIDCKVGDNLEKQLGENWRNAGTIVSVKHHEQHTVACAILPNDIELDTPLRAKNDESDARFSIAKPSYFSQEKQQD